MCGCVSTKGIRESFDHPAWRHRGPGRYRFEAPDGSTLAELSRDDAGWRWTASGHGGHEASMVRAMDAAEAALG